MSHTSSYQGFPLKIIINKKLKHSYISVDKDKNITIKTPCKSEKFIIDLLEDKSSWLEKQFAKIEQTTFLSSEVLHTKDFLRDRIEYFSQEMGLGFNELKFRKMKSRWGSCSSKKIITLNSELLKLKQELVDYVVVHELSHLVHMNHSKEFHAYVEKHLPNAAKYRKELKQMRLS